MRIALCTTCKGRVQHIEQTLPRNLADLPANAVIVLLDYGSPDHLQGYLRKAHGADIESGRLVFYSYPAAGKFQMAHAKNMAHRLGMLEGASVLVNLDADNFMGRGFCQHVEESISDSHFLWSRMIKDGAGRLPKGISGRIAVTTNAFLISGGYDEKFDTWSPDDKDFYTRLRRLGYEAKEISPCYLRAILHNDRMRFKDYPHAQTEMGEDQFHADIYESDTTIANHGKIGCGTVYRNFDLVPIELKPLPTRIFGIGMHKTATTSLYTALRFLGFESAHWKSAHWAKAIWDQMHAEGRSLTLEQHYALCDLPIPVLFEELDAAYPGSKFILTVRDEDNWIKSIRNHWDPTKNPYRTTWNTDPFSHKIHKAIYGQKGFDEEVFRARYRKHNADVWKHFVDRPGDLLIMDMDLNPGWTDLCRFLARPVPEVEYPQAFVTVKHKEIYQAGGGI